MLSKLALASIATTTGAVQLTDNSVSSSLKFLGNSLAQTTTEEAIQWPTHTKLFKEYGCTGRNFDLPTREVRLDRESRFEDIDEEAKGMIVPPGKTAIAYDKTNKRGYRAVFVGPLRACNLAEYPPAEIESFELVHTMATEDVPKEWLEGAHFPDFKLQLFEGPNCSEGVELTVTKEKKLGKNITNTAYGFEVPYGKTLTFWDNDENNGDGVTFTGPIQVCDLSEHEPGKNKSVTRIVVHDSNDLGDLGDKVVVFAEEGCNGDTLELTESTNLDADWNDKPKAIRVPEGFDVTLHMDGLFKGGVKTITGPAEVCDLWNYQWEGGRTSSITIEGEIAAAPENKKNRGKQGRKADSVVVFAEEGCDGDTLELTESTNLDSDWNDKPKAIRVPDGFDVTLHMDGLFKGGVKTITGPAEVCDLWNYQWEGGRTSSITIEPTN